MELCYEGDEELNPYWDLQYEDGDGNISNQEPEGNNQLENWFGKHCRNVVSLDSKTGDNDAGIADATEVAHTITDETGSNIDNGIDVPDSPVSEDFSSDLGINQGTDALSIPDMNGRKVRRSVPGFHRWILYAE